MDLQNAQAKLLKPLLACLAAVLLSSPSVSGSTAGSPPDLLNYSGRLAAPDGLPPGAGAGPEAPVSYTAEFRIYDAPTGGNVLWAETQTITVERGHFSVIIGEGEAIDGEPRPRLSTALAGPEVRHLGITVRFLDSELPVEMSPRQPLLNAPYAMLSSSASRLLDENGAPLATATGDTLEIPLPLVTTQPVQAASISGDAGGLANLDASAITSGLLSPARLPGSFQGSTVSSGLFASNLLPVVPASKLTSIDASRITSGRLPPSVTGTLDASQPVTFAKRQTFREGIVFPWQSSYQTTHQPLESTPAHLDPAWSSGWSTLFSNVGLGSAPAFVSEKISHNEQTGELSVTVDGPGTLTFDWRASSESFDRLRFYRNNSELSSISGNTTNLGVSHQVPSGTQRYSWKYTKDQSIDSRDDRGWVANIRFTRATSGSEAPPPAPYSIALNRNAVLLRGATDSNHFLAHGLNGSLAARWSSPGPVNGAVLAGWNGGALATNSGGQNWSLRWYANSRSTDSNVQVRNQIRIRPNIGSLPTGGLYYWALHANAHNSEATTAPVALTTPGSIAAMSFIAASDARIKESVRTTSTEEALRVVGGLEFVEYRFRDEDAQAPRVGLVAQQVRELDPAAVTLSQRFVPDLLAEPVSMDWCRTSGSLTLTLDRDHGLSAGDQVRLILPGGPRDVPVAAVESAKSFRVDDFPERPESLLVYGRQVDDFHSIDHDRLFASGVVAVQEIQRRVRDSRAKLEDARARLEELRTTRTELLRVRNELREAIALDSPKSARVSIPSPLATTQP